MCALPAQQREQHSRAATDYPGGIAESTDGGNPVIQSCCDDVASCYVGCCDPLLCWRCVFFRSTVSSPIHGIELHKFRGSDENANNESECERVSELNVCSLDPELVFNQFYHTEEGRYCSVLITNAVRFAASGNESPRWRSKTSDTRGAIK